jgi:hypothetical protein
MSSRRLVIYKERGELRRVPFDNAREAEQYARHLRVKGKHVRVVVLPRKRGTMGGLAR